MIEKIMRELTRVENTSGSNAKKEVFKNLITEIPESIDLFRKVYDETLYNLSKKSFEKAVTYDKKLFGSFSDTGEMV